MDLKISACLLLTFLFLVFIVSITHAIKKGKNGSYTVATLSLAFFVTIYCAEILGYNVSGSSLSLSKKVDQLEGQQTQLQNITGILLKMSLLNHKGSLWDGATPGAGKVIEEYKTDLKKYLGPNFENELENDLKRAKEIPKS